MRIEVVLVKVFLANAAVAAGCAGVVGLGLAAAAWERHYTKADTDTWNALNDLAPKYAEEVPVKHRTVWWRWLRRRLRRGDDL